MPTLSRKALGHRLGELRPRKGQSCLRLHHEREGLRGTPPAVLPPVPGFTLSNASGIAKAERQVPALLSRAACLAHFMRQGPSLPAPKCWGQSGSLPVPAPFRRGVQGSRRCSLKGSLENVGIMIWPTWVPTPAPRTLDCNLSQSQFPYM